MVDVISYAPIDYDAENIPPDAPPGAWRATATAKAAKTSKDSLPMIVVDWELDSAYDDENEGFVGSRVSDFLTFFPDTRVQAARMSKVRLKGFCTKLGIPLSVIPKHIASSDDFADFIAAIDGQQADIWTVHETQVNKETNEEIVRVKVLYKAPGSTGSALPPVVEAGAGEEEEEEEQEEEEEEEETAAAATPPVRAVPAAKPAAAKPAATKPAANGKKAAGGRR